MNIREAVERARAAGYPLACIAPMYSGLWAANLRRAWRTEQAEARLRTLCAIVEEDPAPYLTAAAGNPAVLEDFADRIARYGSSADLTRLVAQLADA